MRTTWIVWSLCAAVGAASAGAGPRADVDDPPLRVIVTPRLGRAPAVVRLHAIIRPVEENRGLVFVLDSDTYYRSSAVPIDGDTAARVHHAEFHPVPSGVYRVTVALVDRRGVVRSTVHDAIQIME
jgi:hypothetical protein